MLILADAASLIAAVGSTIAAIAAIVVIFISLRQLGLSRQALYDDHRPVVLPSKVGYEPAPLSLTLQNIGAGLALNVSGIAVSWHTTDPNETRTYRLVFYLEAALPAGERITVTPTDEHTTLDASTTIGSGPDAQSLAPRRGSALTAQREGLGIIWRITLAYHDLYGRKHASVSELEHYGARPGDWAIRTIRLLADIPEDLVDLDRASGTR